MYPNEFELSHQHHKDLLKEGEIRHLARRLRSVRRKKEGGVLYRLRSRHPRLKLFEEEIVWKVEPGECPEP